MVGYPESLTDPSYRSQILTLTYPLIGNYGVPDRKKDKHGLTAELESDKIWASALVVGDYVEEYSHWNAEKSLSHWLEEEGIPGISGKTCITCSSLVNIYYGFKIIIVRWNVLAHVGRVSSNQCTVLNLGYGCPWQ